MKIFEKIPWVLASVAFVMLVAYGTMSALPVIKQYWQKEPPPITDFWNRYEQKDYGFAFQFPKGIEAHAREESVRQTDYLSKPVDFFLTIRTDVGDEEKSDGIASVYWMKETPAADFQKVLESSGPGIRVIKQDALSFNGTAMTRFVSTTEMGVDKYHYVYEKNGKALVISVYLNQENVFDPILKTWKSL